jgi:hypothetical protein
MGKIQHKNSTLGRGLSRPKAEMLKRLRFAARRAELNGEGGILRIEHSWE